MKKLLLVFSVSTLFFSCKKDAVNSSTDTPNLGLMSGSYGSPVLNITTLSDYETIFEQTEGTTIQTIPSGFVSLKSVLNDLEASKLSDSTGQNYWGHPHLADTIYEDYGRLLDVLNKDKIIQLNGHLVKIDLYKDSAYTINSSVQNAYNILLNNSVHDSLKAYPTYMEVGLMLFGINIFTCKEPWAKGDKDKEDEPKCSNSYKTKKKVVYQKAAIYFSLVAKAKNLQRHWYSLGIWYDWNCVEPLLYMNMYYKPRCKAEWAWWEGDARDWYFTGAYNGDGKKSVFRPYSSITALTKYYFSSSIHGCCGGATFLKIEDNM